MALVKMVFLHQFTQMKEQKIGGIFTLWLLQKSQTKSSLFQWSNTKITTHKIRVVYCAFFNSFYKCLIIQNATIYYTSKQKHRYMKVANTEITAKKYRLSGCGEELPLVTDYLDWRPHMEDPQESPLKSPWIIFLNRNSTKRLLRDNSNTCLPIYLTSPTDETVEIVLWKRIGKEAFPLSFTAEERSDTWEEFYIVAKKETPTDKFIIPLQ